MVASQEAAGGERRSERRVRTLKRARIVFNRGYGVFDCMVRNLSPGGALIDVPSALGVPHDFDLILDEEHHPSTVRWHTDHLIGVAFAKAALKAA